MPKRRARQRAKKEKVSSGTAFVGFLFLGLAFGILYNQVAVGVLVGLGLGFLAMVVLQYKGFE
ncbi:MAG: hypothetical protein KKA90_02910 [Nanoarchaeota archaeon]|nr:hypothetical protein [Nanoarchaeota archaeon]